MTHTGIQYCDATINPIRARIGARMGHYCEKISAGCKWCYASSMQPRFGMPTFPEQQKIPGSVVTFLDETRLQAVIRRQKPTRYFWCDMTDLFGSWVPNIAIDRCLDVMEQTPQHTHLLLTKRARRMGEYFADSILPRNIHVGVSIENQRVMNRLLYLQRINAAVQWLSVEPLLERIHLPLMWLYSALTQRWVVIGGESGHRARPCDVEWIRDVLSQCRAFNVPCFVKQVGANPYNRTENQMWRCSWKLRSAKGGDPEEWPEDLRIREFPR